MAITYQCEDGIEPVSDTFGEDVGNVANYNIVSGCAASYSASDMVVTVAVGVATVAGSIVTVPGNTVTLVSDPSLPRWSIVAVNSSGVAVLISGDAATVPAVPEKGDRVNDAQVLIQAGQTIADNIVTKLDKRIIYPANPNFLDELTAFRANRRLVAEYSAQNNSTAGTSSAVGTGFYQYVNVNTDVVSNVSGEPYIQLGTDASGVNGVFSAASTSSNGVAALSPNHSPRWIGRVKFPAASANVTAFLAGFFASGGGATPNGAYLRIVTTGNVFFVTRQGTETTTDLGVLSRTTILGYEIETPDAGVTWILRNQAGTVLATHTATVPTAATALVYGVHYTWATATVPIGVAYQRVEATFA